MSARSARCGHQRFRFRLEGREQRQVGDGDAQIVMFRFIAEGAGHAAAAGVKGYDVQVRNQLEGGGAGGGTEECLLMAMSVKQALSGSGTQGKLAAASLDLRAEPGVC